MRMGEELSQLEGKWVPLSREQGTPQPPPPGPGEPGPTTPSHIASPGPPHGMHEHHMAVISRGIWAGGQKGTFGRRALAAFNYGMPKSCCVSLPPRGLYCLQQETRWPIPRGISEGDSGGQRPVCAQWPCKPRGDPTAHPAQWSLTCALSRVSSFCCHGKGREERDIRDSILPRQQH